MEDGPWRFRDEMKKKTVGNYEIIQLIIQVRASRRIPKIFFGQHSPIKLFFSVRHRNLNFPSPPLLPQLRVLAH